MSLCKVYFTKIRYSIKVYFRKIYAIDLGLVKAVSFGFGKEEGKLLENMVSLELKRRRHEIYYYSAKKECNFVIKKGTKITAAIQVTVNLTDPATREREVSGLMEAMEEFDILKGFIVTRRGEGRMKINKKTIYVIPLWKFLLFGL